MMRYECSVLLFLLLTVAYPCAASAQDPNDILIIVNRANPAGSLALDEVRNIFLGRRTRWSNGTKIIPINVRGAEAVRDVFRNKVLRMTASQESEYWYKMKLEGKGKEPPAMSYPSILKGVFRVKGAVSFVLRRDYREGVVKVVKVVSASE